jgi:DNA-binding MarR family transcriptional regulator
VRHDMEWLDVGLPRFDTRPMATSADDPDALDHLDASLVIWAREIPDLDPLTEGIVERIQMLAHGFDDSAASTLAEFGLDRRAFKVLGRLRRVGPPYQRSAGELAGDIHLSSGAMTNRLDRMEAAGLIRRLPDPNDRRGTLIEPTEAGHRAWDETAGTQGRRESAITAVLAPADREQLNRLLRRLMGAFPGALDHHRHRETEADPTET